MHALLRKGNIDSNPSLSIGIPSVPDSAASVTLVERLEVVSVSTASAVDESHTSPGIGVVVVPGHVSLAGSANFREPTHCNNTNIEYSTINAMYGVTSRT